jgi:hypothetical protein
VFAAQADPSKIVRPKNGEIALADAWLVHASMPVAEDQMRTVLRLTFAMKAFNRLGNSHNGLMMYRWLMRPTPLPNGLIGGPDGPAYEYVPG